jgi:Zn-dependent protease
VGTAVAFFATLLAHELGHAVVARRAGPRVEGITLWLLGGVAKLDGEAANPRAELGIAAVGPLISLVLAASVVAVSAVAGLPRLVVASVAWLARINLLLAIFNLLPAAPLDGGRVLRGLLWWRTQDRLRSAVVAARMGRLLGALLIGLGFGEFVVGAAISGLWLALLGWFLLNAARAEETNARLRQELLGGRGADGVPVLPCPVRGRAHRRPGRDHPRGPAGRPAGGQRPQDPCATSLRAALRPPGAAGGLRPPARRVVVAVSGRRGPLRGRGLDRRPDQGGRQP